MIRVEVTSEADVTRMVAAFTVLPALQDSDYEVFLGGTRRSWRENGLRGGTGTVNTVFYAGSGASDSATAGGGGGSGNLPAWTEVDPPWTRRL